MTKDYNYLTTSNLKNVFKNNFDLANYAIQIAKKHIEDEDPKTLIQIMVELDEDLKRMKAEKKFEGI